MARVFQGVGVSPGVAVGKVFVLHPQWMPVVSEKIDADQVPHEIARFDETRGLARLALEELRDRVQTSIGSSYAGIFDAQLLILDDPKLTSETTTRIRVGRISASSALSEVVGEYQRRFESIDDPYIRERANELSDVHRRLQRQLRGHRMRSTIPDGPLVVVAHTLGPSDAVALARQGAVGLATDVGGPTSHTAILAQALSVPAVAGLHDLSAEAQPGDSIIVDGDTGEVRLLPTDTESEEAAERGRVTLARERSMVTEDPSAHTSDGVPITLRANIEFPLEIQAARRFGARGIGLYRSEFLFLTHSPELPTEEQHFQTYVEIAEAFPAEPVTFRTLDLGGEKYFHEVLGSDESNPVLGLRAVRLCLKRPDIFRPQLRGLLRAATRDNVRMMLPLVTTPQEIWDVRKLLAEEAEDLKSAGVPARGDVPLGIMIEVPAAATAADILAQEADFFSIGSNDLIQYSLAVDRENESVSHLYQPWHPGLLRMLRFVVESARDAGIPVSLCGEMGADVAMVDLLIGLGLRELSMQPRSIAAVRAALRSIDSLEAKQVAERALSGNRSRNASAEIKT